MSTGSLCARGRCTEDCAVQVNLSCDIVSDVPLTNTCFGDVVRIAMEYQPESCEASYHDQHDKAECADSEELADTVWIRVTDKKKAEDDDGKIWFEGYVEKGETYLIDSDNEDEKKLKDESYIYVFSVDDNRLLQRVKIQTSCSRPLSVNAKFGAHRVVELETTKDPPLVVSEDCAGKVVDMTFRYEASPCAGSEHFQGDKVDCDDFGELPESILVRATDKKKPDDDGARVWFDGIVERGGTYTLNAANADEEKLKGDTYLYAYSLDGELLQSLRFHSSCSKPLSPGDVFGAHRLVEMTTTEGGTVTLRDPGPCEIAVPRAPHCRGKVEVLRLLYTGSTCDTTEHSQDEKKVSCRDERVLLDTVFVRASDKEDPDDEKAKIWFEGTVSVNEMFDIKASSAGEKEIKSDTYIHVFDSPGGTLLQNLRIHTSCSQPINLGDQFGAFLTFGIDTSERPMALLGAEIRYTYEISNRCNVRAKNVEVIDDVFGPVPGSPISSIDEGETITLTLSAIVIEDTRNTATVTSEFSRCDELSEERDSTEVIVRELLGDIGLLRGDVNYDYAIDISDPVNLIGFLFIGGAAPSAVCQPTADVNDDGQIELPDLIVLMEYLFLTSDWEPTPVPIVPGVVSSGCP